MMKKFFTAALLFLVCVTARTEESSSIKVSTVGPRTDITLALITNAVGTSRQVRLNIDNGWYSLTNSITFGTNYTLHIWPGSGFIVTRTNTVLTINGTIDAGNYQIFNGPGLVTGTPYFARSTAYPAWNGTAAVHFVSTAPAIIPAVEFEIWRTNNITIKASIATNINWNYAATNAGNAFDMTNDYAIFPIGPIWLSGAALTTASPTNTGALFLELVRNGKTISRAGAPFNNTASLQCQPQVFWSGMNTSTTNQYTLELYQDAVGDLLIQGSTNYPATVFRGLQLAP